MPKKTARPRSSIHKRASSIRKKQAPEKKKIAHIIKQTHTKKISSPHKKTIPRQTINVSVEKKLTENFISLQKVMVNLSSKFDNLANNISKLLEIFEISAKALAEKDFKKEKIARDDIEIIKKLNNLGEQNKVVARGLTLMHEKMTGTEIPKTPMPPQPRQMRPPMQRPGAGMQGYQKSLSTKPEFKKLPSSRKKEE